MTGNAIADDTCMVMYYQSKHLKDGFGLMSPEMMLRPAPCITDLVLAAVHLNSRGPVVTVNNWEPDDPGNDGVWDAVAAVQRAGVNVLALLGGAAEGTFACLARDFEKYYAALRDFLGHRRLDGVDIDIEEKVAVEPIRDLVLRLREDFGRTFLITMAPVAEELWDGSGNVFRGFRYRELYRACGEEIDRFHAQFYNGWGSLANTADYGRIADASGDAARRVVPLHKVVPIALTNPANGSPGNSQYVEYSTLLGTVAALRRTYPRDFRGMAGWEYFNGTAPGVDGPWHWPRGIHQLLMEPRPTPVLTTA
jgi:hypothetical protein